MEASGPAAYLGKRDLSGRRVSGTSRTASRFRGVTHHSRTNRYEAHVWSEGKQVYLGGYGLEIQAATAYDLAACKFRGQDAQTNFDLARYASELEDVVTGREELVHLLRSQSKAMNSVAHDLNLQMEPWELEISMLLHPDKEHLGVYQDERAAARAVDRHSILRFGIDASLSFPLVEYLDILTPDQTQIAVQRGLLPPVLPANYSPAPAPVPIVKLDANHHAASAGLPRVATPPPALGREESPKTQDHTCEKQETEASPSSEEAAVESAQAEPEESTTLLPRTKSATPKSVFDFMEFHTMLLGKRNHSDDDGIAEKKARLISDDIPWLE